MIETLDSRRSELSQRYIALKFRAENICDMVVDNEVEAAFGLIEQSNNILNGFECGITLDDIEICIQEFEESIKRLENALGISI
jgi:hypothetical protein